MSQNKILNKIVEILKPCQSREGRAAGIEVELRPGLRPTGTLRRKR
jgi:hypothetical protein